MEKELHFTFVADNTNINHNQKESKVLQDELYTFCVSIISSNRLSDVNTIFNGNGGLCDTLQKKYKTREFHFVDIYNSKPPFDIMDFEEKLELMPAFCTLVNFLDVKCVVSTVNKEFHQNHKLFASLISNTAKDIGLPVDNEQNNNKTLSLMMSVFSAKKFLEEKYPRRKIIIDKIICDEGLRKKGFVKDFPLTGQNPSPKICFESSSTVPALQIADFMAWGISRLKNSWDGKNAMSEPLRQLHSKLQKVAKRYVNLDVVKINPNHLPNYDDTYNKLTKKKKK